MATLGTFTAGQVLTAAELNAIGTWQDFPAGKGFTGITVGNGTLDQRYCEINDTVLFVASFEFGSTSAMTDGGFDVPVTMARGIDGLSFSAGLRDGIVAFAATVRNLDANSVLIRALSTGGSYVSQAIISSTVPFTWATGDRISIQGVYEKA